MSKLKTSTPHSLKSPVEADRKKIPASIKAEVYQEAGYRCGNPCCSTFVAIELHHIEYVSEGGRDEASNLLPLCPTCHALHHSGKIPLESIRVWKGLLITLNNAFDRTARHLLLYLHKTKGQELWYSGDGALAFAGLIAAGLVSVTSEPITKRVPPSNSTYMSLRVSSLGSYDQVGIKVIIQLTERGQLLVDAWLSGDEKKYLALEFESHSGSIPPAMPTA